MEKMSVKKILKLVLSLAVGILFILIMVTPISILPPLGGFINPTGGGVWDVGLNANYPVNETITVPGLGSTVTVYRDQYGVPYIYAANDYAMYFALGYVQAQDRLWQMDLQRRAFSGTLSEIFGNQTLSIDIFFRQLGLYNSANQTYNVLKTDPTFAKYIPDLQGFADGVNYYINNTALANLPFEFRLLNYKPAPWTEIDEIAFGKFMAYSLAYDSYDIARTQLCTAFGQTLYDQLFPLVQPFQIPVIPTYGNYTMPSPFNYNSNPQPPVTNITNYFNQECNLQLTPSVQQAFAQVQNNISTIMTTFGELGSVFKGSNNWVVSGNYTTTGKPILANDMHLGLSMPPIWYEASLHTQKSTYDGEAYSWWGYTFVGVPLIIAGHNQYAAWGFTNVGGDGIDWYAFTQNPSNSNQYWYNNTWHSYNLIPEPIKVKGAGTYNLTVKETVYGPIVTTNGENLAMKWVGSGVSRIVESVYFLDHAHNLTDYNNALQYWDAPAQNVVFADNQGVHGDIAMRVAGLYPIRAEGLGRFVVNASADPNMNRWIGYINFNDMPYAVNPTQGYLASANQKSAGPNYPYYIGSLQDPGYRARRINYLLHEAVINKNVSIATIKQIQTDILDTSAQSFVPALLQALNSPLADSYKSGITGWNAAVTILQNWNYVMNKSWAAPLIYWQFKANYLNNTFFDEYHAKSISTDYFPLDSVLENLTLNDPNSHWFNNITAPGNNDNSTIVMLKSFQQTIQELTSTYGSNVNAWQWGTFHILEVNHQIGGELSLKPIPRDGSTYTIEAAGSDSQGIVTSGPSEHAIYDLSNFNNSLTALPGGESGNPLSPHYSDSFNIYIKNGYYSQIWSLSASDFPRSAIKYTLILQGV